jgi:hypothetical protein
MWDAKSVQFHLKQAYRVLQATQVRGDYRLDSGGYWPEHLYSKDDIAGQQRMNYARAAKVATKRYSPRDIQIMETVLIGQGGRKGWLVEFLKNKPGASRCLAHWAIWASQGRSIKHECIIHGFAYSTFRKKRDQAAQLLADALNAARVELI